MVDLHTHTIHSDGVLLPAELVRRCRVKGYRAMAITDHVDHSNIESVVSAAIKAARSLTKSGGVLVAPGVEITHVPPQSIAELVRAARSLGALVVVVHGETLVEPVEPGTNRAAIEAGVDVVAHPGLIAEEDAARAAEKGVRLEVSGRKGHSLANGHVVACARRTGAMLSFGSDSHEPGDLPTREFALAIMQGAGLSRQNAEQVLENGWKFLDNVCVGMR